MPGLWCLVVLQLVLTAVFGYPSTVSTTQVLRVTPGTDAGKFRQHEAMDAVSVETELSASLVSPPSMDFYGKNDRPGDEDASAVDADGEALGKYMKNEKGDDASEEGDDRIGKDAIEAASLKDSAGMGQHFFPSFAPVFSLGHSRPPQLFHQDQYYSKSRSHPSLGPDYNPFRAYRDNSFKVPITVDDDPSSNNILGSGNFGVLKGGTYYNDEDAGDLAGGLFKSFYSNNGHGRPYSTNPRPQKYSNNDFFANFRDFADINIPTKTSFSEYVVVYVNKNTSKTDEGIRLLPPGNPGRGERPKNIIEQLSMLDNDSGESESDMSIPEKKSSLHKRKLAQLQQEKASKEKHYYKKKEPLEPLLALS